MKRFAFLIALAFSLIFTFTQAPASTEAAGPPLPKSFLRVDPTNPLDSGVFTDTLRIVMVAEAPNKLGRSNISIEGHTLALLDKLSQQMWLGNPGLSAKYGAIMPKQYDLLAASGQGHITLNLVDGETLSVMQDGLPFADIYWAGVGNTILKFENAGLLVKGTGDVVATVLDIARIMDINQVQIAFVVAENYDATGNPIVWPGYSSGIQTFGVTIAAGEGPWNTAARAAAADDVNFSCVFNTLKGFWLQAQMPGSDVSWAAGAEFEIPATCVPAARGGSAPSSGWTMLGQ